MKYDTDQSRSALLYKPGVVTDPNNSDSDEAFGLSDYAEIHGYGTDPNNPDTDGQFNDGQEIAVNTTFIIL